jgi:hypothetical protein
MAAPFLFGDRWIPHPSTVLHFALELTLLWPGTPNISTMAAKPTMH